MWALSILAVCVVLVGLELVTNVFITEVVRIASLSVLLTVKTIKRGKRMEKTNCKSVKWLLLSLNLCDYTRVCIREHGPQGIVYVGGGYPGKVMQRYADRLVTDSCIYEDALILYVLPQDVTCSAGKRLSPPDQVLSTP